MRRNQTPWQPSSDARRYLTGINRDVLHQPLYDAVRFTATIAAGTVQQFFQTPVGQGTGIAGGAKTELDTNMRLAGQIPRDHVYEAYSPRIVVAFDDVMSANLPEIDQHAQVVNRILYGSDLLIRIVSNEKLRCPAFFVPAGAGISGFTQGFQAAAASFTTMVVQNGEPHQYSAKSLSFPIVIPPLQSFEVNLTFRRAVTFNADVGGIIVWVLLDGVLYRPAMA